MRLKFDFFKTGIHLKLEQIENWSQILRTLGKLSSQILL